MFKSPFRGTFLELMCCAEKITSVAVLRSIITHNFIWDSESCKYLLQVVDEASCSLLAKQFSKYLE